MNDTPESLQDDVTPQQRQRRLYRATSGRMVAGVAAGLAEYMGIDVTIVRIGFVVASFLGGGLGVAAYLACLLLVPEEGASESIATALIRDIQGGR